jgi:hypothetical protein
LPAPFLAVVFTVELDVLCCACIKPALVNARNTIKAFACFTFDLLIENLFISN